MNLQANQALPRLGRVLWLLLICVDRETLAEPAKPAAFVAIERVVQADPARALSEAKARLQRLSDQASPEALQAMKQLAAAQDELELADEALSTATAGLDVARRLDDKAAMAQLLLVQVNAFAIHHRLAEATQSAREAAALSEALNDPVLIVRTLCTQSWLRYGSGYTAEAAELLKRALETAQGNKDEFGVALSLAGMGGQSLSWRGSAAERRVALQQLEGALKVVDVAAFPSFAMGVYHNIGVARQRLQDVEDARLAFEQATRLATQIGNRRTYAANKLQLAMLELDLQHFQVAQQHLADAAPSVGSVGGASMQFTLHVISASVAAGLGRFADAQAHLAAARPLADSDASAPSHARFLQAEADVQERSGHLKAAVATLRKLRRIEVEAASKANDQRAVEMRTLFDLAKKEHENQVLEARERAASFKYGMVLLALVSCILILALASVMLRLQIRKRRYYSEMAYKDELTGLPNRRSILRRAQLESEVTPLSNATLFVAIADLDHFKRINDDYGHDRGDAALKAFAHAMQKVMRESDSLGRYGGEEFLLLTRQKSAAGVATLFERMQEAVHAIDHMQMGIACPITFSMGAAEVGADLDRSIKLADEALYRAKADGRDRCRLA